MELLGKAQRRFSLRFDLPATYSEAANLLFVDGVVPKGLAIEPSGGAGYSDRWNLTWSGDLTAAAPHFTPAMARVLTDVVLNSTLALTPEETAEHKRKLEKALKYRLDFLGMTVGEALERLKPGGYEINGYFVFVGRDPNHPGGTVLEWARVAKNNETFNRDMRYYLLKKGLSLDQSIQAFTKQWQEITIEIILQYMNVLAGIAGTAGWFAPQGFRAINLDTIVEVVTTAYSANQAVNDSLASTNKEDEELAHEVEALMSNKNFKASRRGRIAALAGDRRKARAWQIADTLESLRAGNPTPQALYTAERLESVYGREALVKFMDTGKLPRGIQFSHLFSAAEYQMWAARGDLGVLTDEADHRFGHHAGDTRVPLHGRPRSWYRR